MIYHSSSILAFKKKLLLYGLLLFFAFSSTFYSVKSINDYFQMGRDQPPLAQFITRWKIIEILKASFPEIIMPVLTNFYPIQKRYKTTSDIGADRDLIIRNPGTQNHLNQLVQYRYHGGYFVLTLKETDYNTIYKFCHYPNYAIVKMIQHVALANISLLTNGGFTTTAILAKERILDNIAQILAEDTAIQDAQARGITPRMVENWQSVTSSLTTAVYGNELPQIQRKTLWQVIQKLSAEARSGTTFDLRMPWLSDPEKLKTETTFVNNLKEKIAEKIQNVNDNQNKYGVLVTEMRVVNEILANGTGNNLAGVPPYFQKSYARHLRYPEVVESIREAVNCSKNLQNLYQIREDPAVLATLTDATLTQLSTVNPQIATALKNLKRLEQKVATATFMNTFHFSLSNGLKQLTKDIAYSPVATPSPVDSQGPVSEQNARVHSLIKSATSANNQTSSLLTKLEQNPVLYISETEREPLRGRFNPAFINLIHQINVEIKKFMPRYIIAAASSRNPVDGAALAETGYSAADLQMYAVLLIKSWLSIPLSVEVRPESRERIQELPDRLHNTLDQLATQILNNSLKEILLFSTTETTPLTHPVDITRSVIDMVNQDHASLELLTNSLTFWQLLPLTHTMRYNPNIRANPELSQKAASIYSAFFSGYNGSTAGIIKTEIARVNYIAERELPSTLAPTTPHLSVVKLANSVGPRLSYAISALSEVSSVTSIKDQDIITGLIESTKQVPLIQIYKNRQNVQQLGWPARTAATIINLAARAMKKDTYSWPIFNQIPTTGLLVEKHQSTLTTLKTAYQLLLKHIANLNSESNTLLVTSAEITNAERMQKLIIEKLKRVGTNTLVGAPVVARDHAVLWQKEIYKMKLPYYVKYPVSVLTSHQFAKNQPIAERMGVTPPQKTDAPTMQILPPSLFDLALPENAAWARPAPKADHQFREVITVTKMLVPTTVCHQTRIAITVSIPDPVKTVEPTIANSDTSVRTWVYGKEYGKTATGRDSGDRHKKVLVEVFGNGLGVSPQGVAYLLYNELVPLDVFNKVSIHIQTLVMKSRSQRTTRLPLSTANLQLTQITKSWLENCLNVWSRLTLRDSALMPPDVTPTAQPSLAEAFEHINLLQDSLELILANEYRLLNRYNSSEQLRRSPKIETFKALETFTTLESGVLSILEESAQKDSIPHGYPPYNSALLRVYKNIVQKHSVVGNIGQLFRTPVPLFLRASRLRINLVVPSGNATGQKSEDIRNFNQYFLHLSLRYPLTKQMNCPMLLAAITTQDTSRIRLITKNEDLVRFKVPDIDTSDLLRAFQDVRSSIVSIAYLPDAFTLCNVHDSNNIEGLLKTDFFEFEGDLNERPLSWRIGPHLITIDPDILMTDGTGSALLASFYDLNFIIGKASTYGMGALKQPAHLQLLADLAKNQRIPRALQPPITETQQNLKKVAEETKKSLQTPLAVNHAIRWQLGARTPQAYSSIFHTTKDDYDKPIPKTVVSEKKAATARSLLNLFRKFFDQVSLKPEYTHLQSVRQQRVGGHSLSPLGQICDLTIGTLKLIESSVLNALNKDAISRGGRSPILNEISTIFETDSGPQTMLETVYGGPSSLVQLLREIVDKSKVPTYTSMALEKQNLIKQQQERVTESVNTFKSILKQRVTINFNHVFNLKSDVLSQNDYVGLDEASNIKLAQRLCSNRTLYEVMTEYPYACRQILLTQAQSYKCPDYLPMPQFLVTAGASHRESERAAPFLPVAAFTETLKEIEILLSLLAQFDQIDVNEVFKTRMKQNVIIQPTLASKKLAIYTPPVVDTRTINSLKTITGAVGWQNYPLPPIIMKSYDTKDPYWSTSTKFEKTVKSTSSVAGLWACQLVASQKLSRKPTKVITLLSAVQKTETLQNLFIPDLESLRQTNEFLNVVVAIQRIASKAIMRYRVVNPDTWWYQTIASEIDKLCVQQTTEQDGRHVTDGKIATITTAFKQHTSEIQQILRNLEGMNDPQELRQTLIAAKDRFESLQQQVSALDCNDLLTTAELNEITGKIFADPCLTKRISVVNPLPQSASITNERPNRTNFAKVVATLNQLKYYLNQVSECIEENAWLLSLGETSLAPYLAYEQIAKSASDFVPTEFHRDKITHIQIPTTTNKSQILIMAEQNVEDPEYTLKPTKTFDQCREDLPLFVTIDRSPTLETYLQLPPVTKEKTLRKVQKTILKQLSEHCNKTKIYLAELHAQFETGDHNRSSKLYKFCTFQEFTKELTKIQQWLAHTAENSKLLDITTQFALSSVSEEQVNALLRFAKDLQMCIGQLSHKISHSVDYIVEPNFSEVNVCMHVGVAPRIRLYFNTLCGQRVNSLKNNFNSELNKLGKQLNSKIKVYLDAEKLKGETTLADYTKSKISPQEIQKIQTDISSLQTIEVANTIIRSIKNTIQEGIYKLGLAKDTPSEKVMKQYLLTKLIDGTKKIIGQTQKLDTTTTSANLLDAFSMFAERICTDQKPTKKTDLELWYLQKGPGWVITKYVLEQMLAKVCNWRNVDPNIIEKTSNSLVVTGMHLDVVLILTTYWLPRFFEPKDSIVEDYNTVLDTGKDGNNRPIYKIPTVNQFKTQLQKYIQITPAGRWTLTEACRQKLMTIVSNFDKPGLYSQDLINCIRQIYTPDLCAVSCYLGEHRQTYNGKNSELLDLMHDPADAFPSLLSTYAAINPHLFKKSGIKNSPNLEVAMAHYHLIHKLSSTNSPFIPELIARIAEEHNLNYILAIYKSPLISRKLESSSIKYVGQKIRLGYDATRNSHYHSTVNLPQIITRLFQNQQEMSGIAQQILSGVGNDTRAQNMNEVTQLQNRINKHLDTISNLEAEYQAETSHPECKKYLKNCKVRLNEYSQYCQQYLELSLQCQRGEIDEGAQQQPQEIDEGEQQQPQEIDEGEQPIADVDRVPIAGFLVQINELIDKKIDKHKQQLKRSQQQSVGLTEYLNAH